MSVLQCNCIDPDNLGEPAATCGSPGYKGDGNCDDANNNEGCDYDGGDCCSKTAKNGKVKTKYCTEVGFQYGVYLIVSLRTSTGARTS